MRILLVDDDDSLRRVLSFKLTQRGYILETAADGNQAIERLRSSDFDLLITDIRMPGINGIELLNRLQTICPEIGTIVITAHGSDNLKEEAHRLGVVVYLTKPFEDKEMFDAIESIRTRSRDLSGPDAIDNRDKSTD